MNINNKDNILKSTSFTFFAPKEWGFLLGSTGDDVFIESLKDASVVLRASM